MGSGSVPASIPVVALPAGSRTVPKAAGAAARAPGAMAVDVEGVFESIVGGSLCLSKYEIETAAG